MSEVNDEQHSAGSSAEEHKKRMQACKEEVDDRIAKARQSRGVVLVLTGDGKGKSSSAFGVMARCLGHGMHVGVAQFIKGKWPSGEEKYFAGQDGVEFHTMGTGFTWETQNRDVDIRATMDLWKHAEAMLKNERLSLVILDEITYVLNYGYMEIERLLDALKARPAMQHVIITGRDIPEAVLEMSDTASEVCRLRHAFEAGIKAQKGIEW